MKKHIKKCAQISICILMSLILTSCWSSHELNKLAIVMGIGIDKDKDKQSDAVDVTVQMAKVNRNADAKKGESTGTADYLNIKQKGNSVSEAVGKVNRKINRQLFFSHNQVIIFGQGAAEEGIGRYIDFFLRYRETRLLVWILVAKGQADDVFNVKPEIESTPGRNIGELIKNQESISQIPAVNLKDLASRLTSKTTAAVAPMIEISKEGNGEVYLSETAVFKKGKMVGTLDKKETRGLLWGINKVKNGNIIINTDNKENVNIETISAKGKIIPKIKDNQLSMKIEIKQEGNLQEQTSSDDLANPKEFEKLQKIEEAAIKEEIEAAVKKSRELNADIFGFGDIIYQHYPKQWKMIENNWDKSFQTLHVDISVDAKLRRAGKINKPIMSKD